tara:strand:- start:7 stop:441 length:435 start_codon:yes stop_codon:yes gene_type:complete
VKNKKKINRFYFVSFLLISVSLAVYFVLKALEDKIVFFYTPTNIFEESENIKGYIRLGGLVSIDSIKFSQNGMDVNFSITDNKNIINVTYNGILPDLFREGQGVVVEGRINHTRKLFKAEKVLAKHDENYMPPEVKKAIKGTYK